MGNKPSQSLDLMNLGVLILTGVGMLGSFWGYAEAHFATKDQLTATKDQLTIEQDLRKEMKAEVDALYLKMIPEPERAPLKYQGFGR